MSTKKPDATIRPEQCRVGRAWFGWTQEDLATKSGVSLSTIKDFEKGARSPIKANRSALERVFQAAGLVCRFSAEGAATGIEVDDTRGGLTQSANSQQQAQDKRPETADRE